MKWLQWRYTNSNTTVIIPSNYSLVIKLFTVYTQKWDHSGSKLTKFFIRHTNTKQIFRLHFQIQKPHKISVTCFKTTKALTWGSIDHFLLLIYSFQLRSAFQPPKQYSFLNFIFTQKNIFVIIPWTVTADLDILNLSRVKVNHHTNRLYQRSFYLKVIDWRHTFTRNISTATKKTYSVQLSNYKAVYLTSALPTTLATP